MPDESEYSVITSPSILREPELISSSQATAFGFDGTQGNASSKTSVFGNGYAKYKTFTITSIKKNDKSASAVDYLPAKISIIPEGDQLQNSSRDILSAEYNTDGTRLTDEHDNEQFLGIASDTPIGKFPKSAESSTFHHNYLYQDTVFYKDQTKNQDYPWFEQYFNVEKGESGIYIRLVAASAMMYAGCHFKLPQTSTFSILKMSPDNYNNALNKLFDSSSNSVSSTSGYPVFQKYSRFWRNLYSDINSAWKNSFQQKITPGINLCAESDVIMLTFNPVQKPFNANEGLNKIKFNAQTASSKYSQLSDFLIQYRLDGSGAFDNDKTTLKTLKFKVNGEDVYGLSLIHI